MFLISPHKNLSVSSFAKDNHASFQFHDSNCYVVSQASKLVVLEGILDKNGLYAFKGLPIAKHHQNIPNQKLVSSSKPSNSLTSSTVILLAHQIHKILTHIGMLG